MLPHTSIPTSNFSPIWKQIWATMNDRSFYNGFKFLLGNGDRIKLWDDIWIIEEPLRLSPNYLVSHWINLSLSKTWAFGIATIGSGPLDGLDL